MVRPSLSVMSSSSTQPKQRFWQGQPGYVYAYYWWGFTALLGYVWYTSKSSKTPVVSPDVTDINGEPIILKKATVWD